MQSIDDENKKVVMTYFEYLFENYEQMKIYAHYKGEEYEIHRTVAKQRLKAFYKTLESLDDETMAIINGKYWGDGKELTWNAYAKKLGYPPTKLYRLRERVIWMFVTLCGEDF